LLENKRCYTGSPKARLEIKIENKNGWKTPLNATLFHPFFLLPFTAAIQDAKYSGR
jgi:hypothetical protein